MTTILGISDSHNCAVSVVKNGKIVFSVEEERLSRVKNHDGRFHGLPVRSLREALAFLKGEEIDCIAITILRPWELTSRVWKQMREEMRWSLFFLDLRNIRCGGPLAYGAPFVYALWRRKRMERLLRGEGLKDVPREYWDHHESHAASAYYLSGFQESTICTLDGKGDALCGSVYRGKDGKMEKIREIRHQYSPGFLYSMVTKVLGFKPMRHEGKITGLAALGKKTGAYDKMNSLVTMEGDHFGLSYMRSVFQPPYPFWIKPIDIWKRFSSQFKEYSREDLAYAVQKVTEDLCISLIRDSIKKTGFPKVSLAGGVFSNVKVNQRIAEDANVKGIFICPVMGDNGISLGAAFLSSVNRGITPSFSINDVYLGPEFKVSKESLTGVEYKRYSRIEKKAASLINEGSIVARFGGRMEYGPRALGNRSILADPRDPEINDLLNKRLNRTEFMPFAPVTPWGKAEEFYKIPEGAIDPAKFMTISYECKKSMKESPATVHVDNTARPQLIKEKWNKQYYRILKEFYKLTGVSSLVNTSFNAHEEPIVCTVEDALRPLRSGRVDCIVSDNLLIWKEKQA